MSKMMDVNVKRISGPALSSQDRVAFPATAHDSFLEPETVQAGIMRRLEVSLRLSRV